MGEALRLSGQRHWPLLLTSLVPLLLLVWRFDFVCDDAFITFVYARNLAEGRGLVYNPGEWVEGYSEFLWALILAGGQSVGVSPLILSRALSILAVCVVAHITTKMLAMRYAQAAAPRYGAALFLGCLTPLGVWATSGLATMPFVAAVVLLFHLTWSEPRSVPGWKVGLVAGLAALLRADGAFWVAAILGPAILSGLGPRSAWRRPLSAAVVGAAFFLAHLCWRLVTYGDWLPHTARAKVGLSLHSLSRGADYLVHFLLSVPGVALAIGVGLLALRARGVLPALLVVLATCAYSPLVGGDFMAFGRFLVPMLPFVALGLGAGLERIQARWGGGMAIVLASGCALLSICPAFGVDPVPEGVRTSFSVRHNRGDESRRRSELEQWRNMDYQAREWAALGRGLRLVSDPGDSLVFGAAGAVGWYSGLRLLDRNGLITPSVARMPAQVDPPKSPGHDKTVAPEFFAEVSPTYLFATWVPITLDHWEACVRATGNKMLLDWLEAGRLLHLELAEEGHPYPGHHLIVVPGG